MSGTAESATEIGGWVFALTAVGGAILYVNLWPTLPAFPVVVLVVIVLSYALAKCSEAVFEYLEADRGNGGGQRDF